MIKSFIKLIFSFFTILSTLHHAHPMTQFNSNSKNNFEIILQNKQSNKKIGWIYYKISPFDNQRGIICHVFVKKKYRRHGHGRSLVTQACQSLSSKGCKIVELEVAQGNCVAKNFFKKLGFKELQLDDNFEIFNIFETTFIFRKKLS